MELSKKTAKALARKSEGLLPVSYKSINPNTLETGTVSKIHTALERKLSKAQLQAVKRLGHAIGKVGFSLSDALLHSDLSEPDYNEMCTQAPELRVYVKTKQLEYKYSLLDIVKKQAIESGDSRMAMWLLERQFAEEYDSAIKKDLNKMKVNDAPDVMELAIAFIRRSSSNTMPVQQSAGAEQVRDLDLVDKEETMPWKSNL